MTNLNIVIVFSLTSRRYVILGIYKNVDVSFRFYVQTYKYIVTIKKKVLLDKCPRVQI